MKTKHIKCPACLKNSGYTTDTEFSENQYEPIYETRFAKNHTNGYIADGFEAVCDKCEYEFYIYGYVPEPMIEIQDTIDGRAFINARGMKWPSFIKDDWDLREFESVLTSFITGEKSIYKPNKKMIAFIKKAIKIKPKKEETEEEEFIEVDEAKELHNVIEELKKNRDKNIFDITNYMHQGTIPWYKRIWNKIKE